MSDEILAIVGIALLVIGAVVGLFTVLGLMGVTVFSFFSVFLNFIVGVVIAAVLIALGVVCLIFAIRSS